MAKPLGPKSQLIREAIKNNPDLGNKEISELLNGSADRKGDKIEVSPQDIAQQKQQMKKAGESVRVEAPKAKRGRPKGAKPAVAHRPTAAPTSGPVDVINGVFALAQQCGGIEQLKTLVDRMAELKG